MLSLGRQKVSVEMLNAVGDATSRCRLVVYMENQNFMLR